MAEWAGSATTRAPATSSPARARCRAGGFPDSEEELRKLPGLGAYTAAAVAAIAFGQRAVVVDANVERVSPGCSRSTSRCPARARRFAARPSGSPRPTRRRFRAGDDGPRRDDLHRAQSEVPAVPAVRAVPRPAQGARPNCRSRRQEGQAAAIGTAFWIERDGKVWLVAPPAKGMLGGMRALPDDGWSARADGSGDAPSPGAGARAAWCGTASPTSTSSSAGDLRRRQVGGLEAANGGRSRSIDGAGLPTLFAKAARLALAR
jgi:A/G-specific adenine glycosylase